MSGMKPCGGKMAFRDSRKTVESCCVEHGSIKPLAEAIHSYIRRN